MLESQIDDGKGTRGWMMRDGEARGSLRAKFLSPYGFVVTNEE